MQRKLIKQGTGLTIYLPKKWIDKRGLKRGEQVEISILNNDLIISSPNKKKEKKTITLTINNEKESIMRTELVNAYRLGFDKINLETSAKKQEIINMINKFMVGFELFEISNNKYSIESFTEPSYEDFNNIINKQFFILEQIINNIQENIEIDVNRIQKYDNFLKRCISKELLNHPGSMYLWRFLSKITRVARLILHFKEEINISKLKLTQENIKTLNRALEMLKHLRISFAKKQTKEALKTHKILNKYRKEFKNKIEKNPIKEHHLISILTEIYLCSSPLVGFIQAEYFNKNN